MRQLLLHTGTERASFRNWQLLKKLLQPGEPPDDLVQGGLLSCKMQADQVVHRLPEKAGARHGRDADFPDHPFAEFQIRPPGKLR